MPRPDKWVTYYKPYNIKNNQKKSICVFLFYTLIRGMTFREKTSSEKMEIYSLISKTDF